MDVVLAGHVPHRIPIEDASCVGQARRCAQQCAREVGFDETDSARAALVATELASNVFKHAGRGAFYLQQISARDGGRGLELVAVDRGPGFDLSRCMEDGMSTRGTQGIGLGAVARQSQVFDVHSDAGGSVVLSRLHAKQKANVDLRYGAAVHAYEGEPVCGDAWRVAFDAGNISALMIDGLGHGALAHKAGVEGAVAFEQDPFQEVGQGMDTLHAAMGGTRGGAVAIARYEHNTGALRFAGIGNISAGLHTLEGSRGLASHPGIVGVAYRNAKAFDFPEATDKLLVMHSDGVATRWSLRDHAGLMNRHPAVIAAVLLRDHDRGRDDATVVVVPLGGRP
jgi:anti-sigma regulatory factor (Ser/Thr protein kinase)